MGPTASGKTAAALKLAQEWPIEVISVDSALVYRDMDIGTAKPTSLEQTQCPHHLIDIITPEESYSAAAFCQNALALITEINARGCLPVLVGGTMLYFKALHDGLSDLPQADKDLREEIEYKAKRDGWPALHAELTLLDPDAAARLNPNDAQRIQRALEIVKITGRPLAENYQQKTKAKTELNFLRISLDASIRNVLHERLENRFDAMLAAGLESELLGLRKHYQLSSEMSSMRCVGYRQMWAYLEGLITQEEMRFKGIAASRQLAKRQITWLRQFRQFWPDVREIDCLAADHVALIHKEVEAWQKT